MVYFLAGFLSFISPLQTYLPGVSFYLVIVQFSSNKITNMEVYACKVSRCFYFKLSKWCQDLKNNHNYNIKYLSESMKSCFLDSGN